MDHTPARSPRRAWACLAARRASRCPPRAGDHLRLGLLHTLSPAPFYIAQERGYFTDEGIDLTFSFFEAAQPIAAAAVAGDIDVGVTALTGGFFNLAAKGALKVIGGGLHEQSGYERLRHPGVEPGLRGRADLARQAGRAQLRDHPVWLVVPLHAGPHRRGQGLRRQERDAAAGAADRQHGRRGAAAARWTRRSPSPRWRRPLAASGQAHIIGWVGDIVPYQITALFTTRRMIARQADLLHRVLPAPISRGWPTIARRSCAWTHEGRPIIDAKTDAAIAADQQIRVHRRSRRRARRSWAASAITTRRRAGCGRCEAQLAWFKAQGLVKGDADPASLIDTRFLPTR